MEFRFSKNAIAMAVVAVTGATTLVAAPTASAATATTKVAGNYVAGDFHNHTTCSDGSISMQKLVNKSTGKNPGTWGLDWFVQAGHGGNGNRNCSLVEDASLATPGYPFTNQGPTTTWANSIGTAQLKGDNAATSKGRVFDRSRSA